MGAPREKSLPQEIEEMPPSGNPGTTTTVTKKSSSKK
jgi:hypothetical protein